MSLYIIYIMFYYNYKYKIVNKFSMLLYHVKLNGANIGLT